MTEEGLTHQPPSINNRQQLQQIIEDSELIPKYVLDVQTKAVFRLRQKQKYLNKLLGASSDVEEVTRTHKYKPSPSRRSIQKFSLRNDKNLNSIIYYSEYMQIRNIKWFRPLRRSINLQVTESSHVCQCESTMKNISFNNYKWSYVVNVILVLYSIVSSIVSLKKISILNSSGVHNSLKLYAILYVFISSSLITPSNSLETKFAFPRSHYNVSIHENCLPRTYVRGAELMGIPIPSLLASVNVRYSIRGGDPEGFFAVEQELIGEIAILHIRTRTGLKDVLNRERRAKYTLNILANARSTQKHIASLTASTVVRIIIEDSNDNIPLFYPDTYSVEAKEDLPVNSALTHVTAQDPDADINGEVYYFLADSSSNKFSVHPTTGKVGLTRSLYNDQDRQFFVRILARDRGSRPEHLRKSAIAEAVVDINVVRVNKYSPKLSIKNLPQLLEHSEFHIYAIITVTDADEGISGIIDTVEIVDGNAEKIFKILKGSSVNEYNLIVLNLLERSALPFGYNLTFRATDRGRPKKSSEISLMAYIASVNEHAAIFLKKSYEVDVNEESPIDTPAVRIAASESDFLYSAPVSFRLVAGNQDKKFKINSKTGLISTAGWLDAETKAYYSLTVAAIDQTSSARRKQSSAKVTIRVLDANDNAPEFITPNTEVTLDENESSGSYVTRITASDVDSNENGFISYSIANIDPVPFTIDSFDGVIRTTKVLDYELGRRTYTITVRASDWGQPLKKESETTVKVKVRDINDNTPEFIERNCSGWLSSSTPAGSHILALNAIDRDANSVVAYNLVSRGNNLCWSIDSTSGVLSLSCDLKRNVLKRNKSQTVIVNVTASDGRYTSEAMSVILTIVDSNDAEKLVIFEEYQVKCKDRKFKNKPQLEDDISNENNSEIEEFAVLPPRFSYNAHSPKFSKISPSFIDVYENSNVGLEIYNSEATDDDHGNNGRIVYSISSGDLDSVFEINIFTGIISIASPLDRERTSVYQLNINAYDLGLNHLSASKNVTVNVLDVNDNAPEFTKVSYSLHLPENTKNGTSVAQLLAIDPDEEENAEVSYELATNTEDFILDSVSGSLYVARTLDRERISDFELIVRAWDNGKIEQKYSMARVFITVIDLNDCAPNFGAGSVVTVIIPEDYPIGTVVATMFATDPDLGEGGKIAYSIHHNKGNLFRIDSETGIVRILVSLDYEKNQFHNLTIRAADSGSPSLHSDATLLVLIEDVPESVGSAHFQRRVMKGKIKENEQSGTLATTLQASSGESEELHFAITEGNGLGLFSVSNRGEYKMKFIIFDHIFS